MLRHPSASPDLCTRAPSGLADVGDLAWGSHLCQVFRSRSDLVTTLVPFFAAGLANQERCLWITAPPLGAAAARVALEVAVPDLSARLRDGQIRVVDHADPDVAPGHEARWCDEEARALGDGYQGLRVGSNASFLAPEDWPRFAAYEATIHRSLEGRRVVAICSYSIEQLDANEDADILRDHTLGLVPRDERWELVHSATAALASVAAARDEARPRAAHRARFFHEAAYPADELAAYLYEGLARRAAVLVFASGEHIASIASRLAARGVDLVARVTASQLVFVDADPIASALLREDADALAIFGVEVVRRVEAALTRFPCVRGYGEIVDRLAADGEDGVRRALSLERLWEELLAGRPIELLCGYALDRFASAERVPLFHRVCGAHGEVTTSGRGEDQRLWTELQQAHVALEREAADRAQLVRDRERLLDDGRALHERAGDLSRHLARLQELTSALASVLRVEDVARVVASELSRGASTDAVRLRVPSDDGTRLFDAGASDEIDGADAPATAAYRTGRAVWATDAPGASAVPVSVRGRPVGVLTCVHRGALPTATARALLEDCAKQVGLALDRARSYEDVRRERARAEHASRAKDEFLAMLGHELRNPLAPILTAVELMRSSAPDVVSREREVIARQVKHMVRLVDDLLDVSRIACGEIALERSTMEVARLVADALEIASPALEERALCLTLEVPATGLAVEADGARVVQVIVNLLTNAAKFTPRGGRVRVSAHRAGDEVALEVCDEGIGIEPQLLPRVFDHSCGGPCAGIARARASASGSPSRRSSRSCTGVASRPGAKGRAGDRPSSFDCAA